MKEIVWTILSRAHIKGGIHLVLWYEKKHLNEFLAISVYRIAVPEKRDKCTVHHTRCFQVPRKKSNRRNFETIFLSNLQFSICVNTGENGVKI